MKLHKLIETSLTIFGFLVMMVTVHEATHVVHHKIMNPDIDILEFCVAGYNENNDSTFYAGWVETKQGVVEHLSYNSSHPEVIAYSTTFLFAIMVSIIIGYGRAKHE